MKEIITLSHLRLLANRIVKYCKENLTYAAISVSDDGAGNVTITITKPEAIDNV